VKLLEKFYLDLAQVRSLLVDTKTKASIEAESRNRTESHL